MHYNMHRNMSTLLQYFMSDKLPYYMQLFMLGSSILNW